MLALFTSILEESGRVTRTPDQQIENEATSPIEESEDVQERVKNAAI